MNTERIIIEKLRESKRLSESILVFDEYKFENVAKMLYMSRHKHNLSVRTPGDIDIGTLLYALYGLEDGKDYQVGNGELEVLIRRPSDNRWSKVRRDLC